MSTSITVTDLDFDTIKSNIKTYFESKTEYTDWDFDGSGLNMLLDILAYNTHVNSVNAHFALNEAFLKSAQLRTNVVSHAKTLGYTPQSNTAASIEVTLLSDLKVGDITGTPGVTRGTIFETSGMDGTVEEFVSVTDRIAASKNLDKGLGEGAQDYYTIENLVLKQGTRKIMKYTVDGSLSNQRFEIPHENIDISTLIVKVTPPGQVGSAQYYTRHSDLLSQQADSPVYFIQENYNELYEIYLGDGYVGLLPANGSEIQLDYFITDGSVGNGVNALAINETTFNGESYALTVIDKSAGGMEKESTESIRLNAPLSYVTQNRAITADDYKVLIAQGSSLVNNYNNIAVWGGENEGAYGKVYIAIKPAGANSLTVQQKADILEVLRKKNVITIKPEIVDPTIVSLFMDVAFYVDKRATNLSAGALTTLVTDTITDYNDTALNSFEAAFRFSRFLDAIDSADPGIVSSIVKRERMWMAQSITTSNEYKERVNYLLEYPVAIYTKNSGPVITTAPIGVLNERSVYIGDDSTEARHGTNQALYLWYTDSKTKVLNTLTGAPLRIGYINAHDGIVKIINLTVDSWNDDNEIEFRFIPNEENIAPRRNAILQIDTSRTNIEAIDDKVVMEGIYKESLVNRVNPY